MAYLIHLPLGEPLQWTTGADEDARMVGCHSRGFVQQPPS